MIAPRSAPSRASRLAVAAAVSLAALVVAQPSHAQVMTYWGWGAPPPPWGGGESRPVYRSYSSRQIADLLYRYHGAQHVLLVRPAGDVFEADVIDRRGYRIRYTLARDTAEVLDRYPLGRERYMAPVPVPPGAVPDGWGSRDPRAAPPRQARGLPPERSMPVRPQIQEAPTAPAPGVGPVERRPLPEPPVAARPAGPDAEPAVRPAPQRPDAAAPAEARPETPRPARPELARPQPLQPEPPRQIAPQQVAPQQVSPPAAAQPDARPPVSAQSRTIQPPPRIPEPLTDPRTGKPNTASPVTPLDDTPRKGATAAPSVPPAVLD